MRDRERERDSKLRNEGSRGRNRRSKCQSLEKRAWKKDSKMSSDENFQSSRGRESNDHANS